MKRIHLLLFTSLALLLFPSKNYGQITLGAAASKFTIFTASGAVGDNAVAHSHVTGDVGSSTPGPITGFGNVDGVMHPGADLATAACVTALSATIIQLNAATPTLFPAALLGNGATFTAGVYSIPGNATLSLNLFLDAQNVSGAEFIIKIGGTFGATTNAKVILVNGAQACHVYWQINGAVTLASLVTMRGNIISNGAINMGSGDSLEGRALTTVGLIGIDGITAFKPIGCSSPVLTGPPAPNAGSINCYTIFSSIGALQNSIGTSTVIGDVGKDNDGSSITGWTPGAVTGTLHSLRDASTIQCVTDLSKLYDTLNAMTPDITLLFPAQFGHDLTLSPHVYQMNSAATFTDSLYLDAQNNANAIFVIKIAGSLTTSTYAKVKLINGAQSKNVFWVIQGALNVNNYSVMRGTFIVPAGAINMVNTGIVLDGRALTMNGAITTQGLTATMSPGCGATTIIIQPVSKTVCLGSPVYFNAKSSQPGVTYQWRKGNVNMVNSANISGATSDTLKILSATLADTSSYYYLIANGALIDSTYKVSLTVNLPPNVITDPINKTVCLGDSIYFRVVASGTGVTYQWKKGNLNLVNGPNVNGATADTLKLTNISIADSSVLYHVVVSGACSPKDSSIYVSLTVNTPPSVITEPINQLVCLGNATYFFIKENGIGLTYNWRKGNSSLINGVNISGANKDTLRFNNVSLLDTASNYNVIVTGLCAPSDTSVFVSLKTNIPPVILNQPTNQSVCSGNNALFNVSAIGAGITYQWRKGNVNLVNSGLITGATTDSLTIIGATNADTSSFYNVVITGNCLTSIISNSVKLTVNPLPVATVGGSLKVCVGNTLVLNTPSVSGATYHWSGPNGFISTAQNPTIPNAQLVNSGVYSLFITVNGCNSTPATINIVVAVCITDLSTTKTVNNLKPLMGRKIIFTITAHNGGPDTAHNVVITDVLQSGYTYVSVTTTTGVYDNVTGAWNIGTMLSGSSEVLTLTAIVKTSGIFTNTSNITGMEFDGDLSNNTSIVDPIPTDFNIPEGFSPNNDGINDLYVIRGIEYFPSNTFTIFNRWGNKVFEANPYKNTWDGRATTGIKVGGDMLPVGTYFYVIDLGDGSPVIKGTIYLNK